MYCGPLAPELVPIEKFGSLRALDISLKHVSWDRYFMVKNYVLRTLIEYFEPRETDSVSLAGLMARDKTH